MRSSVRNQMAKGNKSTAYLILQPIYLISILFTISAYCEISINPPFLLLNHNTYILQILKWTSIAAGSLGNHFNLI